MTHDPNGAGFARTADTATNAIVMEALDADKREALTLALKARWVALAVTALLLPILNPTWLVLYYEAILVLFALNGWLQMRIGRVGQSRPELLLLFIDLALLTFTLVVPNPFVDYPWPTAMQYRFDGFAYFFIFLAGGTLAYSWRTVFAIGTWTSGLWLGAAILVWLFGSTYPDMTDKVSAGLAGYPQLLDFLDPNDLRFQGRLQEVIVFVIVAGILAVSGWRTNQLLLKQANASRERANLARYFPPSIVDRLADKDQPLGSVRAQPVAVMFADIVGFTKIAERQTPDQVVATLREFHARLERIVFDHDGTLDKYLGDGLMATFGTPEAGEHDARNALNCAQAMMDEMAAWNGERKAAGQVPLPLSIGIHYGGVVLGDIGSARRLEFAVLGDVVNVASRLEALTRELDVKVIVSDDLIQAVREDLGEQASAMLSRFENRDKQEIRGRQEPVLVWTLKDD